MRINHTVTLTPNHHSPTLKKPLTFTMLRRNLPPQAVWIPQITTSAPDRVGYRTLEERALDLRELEEGVLAKLGVAEVEHQLLRRRHLHILAGCSHPPPTPPPPIGEGDGGEAPAKEGGMESEGCRFAIIPTATAQHQRNHHHHFFPNHKIIQSKNTQTRSIPQM